MSAESLALSYNLQHCLRSGTLGEIADVHVCSSGVRHVQYTSLHQHSAVTISQLVGAVFQSAIAVFIGEKLTASKYLCSHKWWHLDLGAMSVVGINGADTIGPNPLEIPYVSSTKLTWVYTSAIPRGHILLCQPPRYLPILEIINCEQLSSPRQYEVLWCWHSTLAASWLVDIRRCPNSLLDAIIS